MRRFRRTKRFRKKKSFRRRRVSRVSRRKFGRRSNRQGNGQKGRQVPLTGRKTSVYKRVWRWAHTDIQQTSTTGSAGIIEVSLNSVAGQYNADWSSLITIFDLVKLDRIRVEFQPTYDSIVMAANIQGTGTGVNPPYYGELLTARPYQNLYGSITTINKNGFLDFERVRRSKLSQTHVRSFKPQTTIINTYSQETGGSYTVYKPVSMPWSDITVSQTYPRALPVLYYLDAANSVVTNSETLMRVYVTAWVTFKARS